jgi:hypothetical protein
VRLEKLALLLPDDHPLAQQPTIPLPWIDGRTIDTSGGNAEAPEWVELGAQLVTEHGGTPAPDHHPGTAAVAAAGADETGHHLRTTGWPILTKLDGPHVTGAVVRPLTDPVPLYPWWMVRRRDLQHPALSAPRPGGRPARRSRTLAGGPGRSVAGAGRPRARGQPVNPRSTRDGGRYRVGTGVTGSSSTPGFSRPRGSSAALAAANAAPKGSGRWRS